MTDLPLLIDVAVVSRLIVAWESRKIGLHLAIVVVPHGGEEAAGQTHTWNSSVKGDKIADTFSDRLPHSRMNATKRDISL